MELRTHTLCGAERARYNLSLVDPEDVHDLPEGEDKVADEECEDVVISGETEEAPSSSRSALVCGREKCLLTPLFDCIDLYDKRESIRP